MECDKRTSRQKLSNRQLQHLVEYMDGNRNVATGKLDSEFKKSDRKKKWTELSKELNNIGWSKKSSSQWRKVWADQKFAIKKKIALLQKEAENQGKSVFKSLLPVEKRILRIVNWDFPAAADCRLDVLKEISELGSSSENNLIPDVVTSLKNKNSLREDISSAKSFSEVAPAETVPPTPSVTTPSQNVASIPRITTSPIITSVHSAISSPSNPSVQNLTPVPVLLTAENISSLPSVPNIFSVPDVLPYEKIFLVPDVSSNVKIVSIPELFSLKSEPYIYKIEKYKSIEDALIAQRKRDEESASKKLGAGETSYSAEGKKEEKLKNPTDTLACLRDIIKIQNEALMKIAESSYRQAEEASKQTVVLTELVNDLRCILRSTPENMF